MTYICVFSYRSRGWFSERGVYSESSGEGSVFDYNNYEGGSFKSTATRNYNSIREDEVKDLSYTETVLPKKVHSRHASLLDGRMLGGNLLVGGKIDIFTIPPSCLGDKLSNPC